MGDDHGPGPLEDLGARIRELRAERQPKSVRSPLGGRDSALSAAFRIGVELVSALGVGVVIGLLLDRWLGTAPWLMIVFFFLGSGAGVLNVYRAASGIGLAPGYRPGPPGPEAEDDGGTKGNGRE